MEFVHFLSDKVIYEAFQENNHAAQQIKKKPNLIFLWLHSIQDRQHPLEDLPTKFSHNMGTNNKRIEMENKNKKKNFEFYLFSLSTIVKNKILIKILIKIKN